MSPATRRITVTIKADTRAFRRNLYLVQLRYEPRYLRRLYLRYRIWKVGREQAP